MYQVRSVVRKAGFRTVGYSGVRSITVTGEGLVEGAGELVGGRRGRRGRRGEAYGT